MNVELYHGVKRGARNGIDTSDWLEAHSWKVKGLVVTLKKAREGISAFS